MLDFVDGRYDVLGVDRDHRERPRHPARQHDDHRPRRPLRPRAALPAARARRAQQGARVLLPRRAAAQRDDRRGAVAHRGARAAHRARERLPDCLARPRAARGRRPARRRAVGQRRQRGLRSVLPHARRGGARAARRGGHARRRPRAELRRRGAPARGLRDRRRRAPVALQAPRERRPTRRTSPSSPPRWRTASARRPRRRGAWSSSWRSRRSCGGCARSAARRTQRVVTLHLRDDTPLDPAQDHGAHPQDARARGSSRRTCASRAASTRATACQRRDHARRAGYVTKEGDDGMRPEDIAWSPKSLGRRGGPDACACAGSARRGSRSSTRGT